MLVVSGGAQVLAILLVGLVAGSMFGIWRGYEVAAYTPATFIEVHQGAVRGLNALLPAMAMAGLALTVLLAVLARSRPWALGLYVVAALLIVAGGLITRLLNQPINEQVMGWTAATLPANWTAVRDTWWTWHVVRLAATAAAQVVLIVAVFVDRDGAA